MQIVRTMTSVLTDRVLKGPIGTSVDCAPTCTSTPVCMPFLRARLCNLSLQPGHYHLLAPTQIRLEPERLWLGRPGRTTKTKPR